MSEYFSNVEDYYEKLKVKVSNMEEKEEQHRKEKQIIIG